MQNKQRHFHFIGICGVAMSALAMAFKRQGYKITGSDVGFYPPISTFLEASDIEFYPGWHPEKMGTPDLVVVGNVASSTNPEWLYVQAQQLPYCSYPELVRDYFIQKNSIVAAGTFGKTTSTALLAWIVSEAGLNPNYMFGGLCPANFPSAALSPSDWSVVEGDEYKTSRSDTGPKFAYYSPTHALLTSIVWDHADVYPTEKLYVAAFQKLVDSLPANGVLVISEKALPLIALPPEKKLTVISYGRERKNAYRYANISSNQDGLSFEIRHADLVYQAETKLLGDYMADNITGCFALAEQIGLAPDVILKGIASFPGIRRRLEKRYSADITIFDDIAHSPSKATGVLESLKKIYDTHLTAVFEPNTGNRQSEAAPWYDHAFAAADTVIIPRLTKIKKNLLVEHQPFEGPELAAIIGRTHPNVRYIEDDSEVITYLKEKTPPGGVVVFLGSHGFRGMIEQLISRIGSKQSK